MNGEIKVVQINALGKSGSTGRTTREMHEYLTKHGIESHIATGRGDDCTDSFAISTKNGVYFDVLLSVISGLDGYHSVLQTKKLLQYIDELKPDIIHLRNLHQSFINLPMLLRYLATRDIATVVTLHDSWFFTGKCCSPDLYACDKWLIGCGQCPALRYDKRRRLFDRTKKMWRDKRKLFLAIPNLAVVGNSLWTTENAKKSFLSSAKIVKCIYNWIDLDVFSPQFEGKIDKNALDLNGKKIILAVSSFWSISGGKGFLNYLQLAQKCPDNWCIVLIGEMRLQDSLPKNVLHIPPVKEVKELAAWYSMADVYLNYSESETFGKSVAEALSCGTPVVALNRTANPELVPEGAGVIINTPEPQETLVALQQIFSRPKKDYLPICRTFAEERFNKDKNIAAYIDVYHQLIESKRCHLQ